MRVATNECDKRMRPKEEIDSPLPKKGNSRKCPAPGDKTLTKGSWTSAEDKILIDYVTKHGKGNWNAVQKNSGLLRCGKSCRLRWANHLRPDLKKCAFTVEEEFKIAKLHYKLGNKWAVMATHFPGRTDNELKNHWNTRIKRCMRNNTPLYPPSIFAEGSDGNQGSGDVCGDNKPNSYLRPGNNHDLSISMIDSLEVNQGTVPFSMAPFPNICLSDALQGFSSQSLGIGDPALHGSKRLRDWETLFPGFQGDFANMVQFDMPYGEAPDMNYKIPRISGGGYAFVDPNQDGEHLAPVRGMVPGGHALLNKNFSASGPLYGTAKLELPSLQYQEMGLFLPRHAPMLREAVDARMMTPLAAQSMDSDFSFESLLHNTGKEMDKLYVASSEYNEHDSSPFQPYHMFCGYGVAASSSGHVLEPVPQSLAASSDTMPSQTEFVGRDAFRFPDCATEFVEDGVPPSYLCPGDSNNEASLFLPDEFNPEVYQWSNASVFRDDTGDAASGPSCSSTFD